MFKLRVFLGVSTVVAAVLVPGPVSSAPRSGVEGSASKAMVVGKDDAGDWGCNTGNCDLAPLADVLGQDLVSASIEKADAKTLNFIIGLNALPPSGGIPEISRYTWELITPKRGVQLSGGFTEYIRGVCNPTYNPLICPPPRDPGMAPFFLRVGGCTVGGACEEIGLVHATFDAASATITIPVPMAMLGVKPGSKISGGASLFGGTIYAVPAAMITNTSLPADTLIVDKTYVVPK